MKTKVITLVLALSLFSIGVSAQTIKENIDKAAKDKNTMDRSAKADVLMQKKIITEPSQTTITPVKVVTKTATVTKATKVKATKKKYKVKRRSSSK